MAYIVIEKKFGFLFNKYPDRNNLNNQIINLQSVYANELDWIRNNFSNEWFELYSLISSHQIPRNLL